MLTDQDLDSQHPLRNVVTGTEHLRYDYWAHPVAGHYELLSPRAITIVAMGGGEQAASKESWSRAVRSSNSGERPPDVWLLLRDARNAQRRKLHRRSVLDSATAAELVLSTAITTCMQSTQPRQLVALVQDQNKELGRKSELARKLGVNLPPAIKPDLIDVRNRGNPRQLQP